jgi:UDPglucose--hexose-1-phosphate uridylyltransferase
LDEYCIIATERGKRPSDFKKEKSSRGDPSKCPFCPGNEGQTPPATAVYTDEGVLDDSDGDRVRPWNARVFPNLYAAMMTEPLPPSSEWIALAGRGRHEVIVESPDHDKSPADFSQKELELLIKVYRDRYSYHLQAGGAAYVSIFKNWGDVAGASLSHTHSQLVALPIVPPSIKRELSVISSSGFCPYCNIVERESASKRLIAQNRRWIAIAPFFSMSPYETWILPKACISSLQEMDDLTGHDLAALLGDVLKRLKILLDDPPYNCMIFQLPSGYHMSIRVQPVISKIAGFEKGTGIFINPTPPEMAASELSQA